jgi:hypothetical protein
MASNDKEMMRVTQRTSEGKPSTSDHKGLSETREIQRAYKGLLHRPLFEIFFATTACLGGEHQVTTTDPSFKGIVDRAEHVNEWEKKEKREQIVSTPFPETPPPTSFRASSLFA